MGISARAGSHLLSGLPEPISTELFEKARIIQLAADKVLFLYRHDYYVNQGTAQPEEGTEGTAEVIVSKHRNGPTGEVRLHFRGETMKFFDMETHTTFRPRDAA